MCKQAKAVTLRTHRYCSGCRGPMSAGESVFKLRSHYAHAECILDLGAKIALQDVVRDVMSASTRDAEHLIGYDPAHNTASGNCRSLEPLTCWVFWAPKPEILARINKRFADVSRELMAELSEELGEPFSERGFLTKAETDAADG